MSVYQSLSLSLSLFHLSVFHALLKLTCWSVVPQSLVLEAEDPRQALEVGVLHDQIPLAVVMNRVVVGHGHFYSPEVPVAQLHVPVNLDRAHVPGASNERWNRLSSNVVKRYDRRSFSIPDIQNNHHLDNHAHDDDLTMMMMMRTMKLAVTTTMTLIMMKLAMMEDNGGDELHHDDDDNGDDNYNGTN